MNNKRTVTAMQSYALLDREKKRKVKEEIKSRTSVIKASFVIQRTSFKL